VVLPDGAIIGLFSLQLLSASLSGNRLPLTRDSDMYLPLRLHKHRRSPLLRRERVRVGLRENDIGYWVYLLRVRCDAGWESGA
jgi:hypothetical protein